MGRRALRRIDSSLDLTDNLIGSADLPECFDATALFGRAAPLEVEVGSGKGLFLLQASGGQPERDFLGVEIAKKYAEFAAAKLAKAQRRNAIVLHADARWLFRHWLTESCAQAVHIYFPDPWWKKRHHKRRIMIEPFLADVQRILAPGGALHFWTDAADYYRAGLAAVAQGTQLAGPLATAERPAEHDLDYRTHFERRMRLSGEAVYRAEFRKPGSASAASSAAPSLS